MDYRVFGKTGLRVSVITLGTMRFLHGWDPPHDHLPEDSLAHARFVLNQALSAGINVIETARWYGKSQRLIGQILPELDYDRADYLIMTKAPVARDAQMMREWVLESRGHLNVDHIELFAVHGVNSVEDYERLIQPGGPLSALEQLREEGVIGHIGIATHAAMELQLRMVESGFFSFINLHYYRFMTVNKPVIEVANRHNMGVFIISPNDKGGQLYEPPDQLKALCNPLPPALFNERWLLNHTEIHTLSVGPNQPGQLDLHQQAIGQNPLMGPVEQQIESRIADQFDNAPLGRCGVCRACLPCPEQIDIPSVLRLRNLADRFQMLAYGQTRYSMMAPGDFWNPSALGNACTTCGDCLPRCPESLDIPVLLKSTHPLLDSWGFRLKRAWSPIDQRLPALVRLKMRSMKPFFRRFRAAISRLFRPVFG
ncbi:MAG: aldo/keto reductase [Magnetococcales bacterium]|nr:aldo/keto reductase [Magnetococcales bacterium]